MARLSSIPGRFYILVSREAVTIPRYAAGNGPPTSRLRRRNFGVHMQGIFDPGLGHAFRKAGARVTRLLC